MELFSAIAVFTFVMATQTGCDRNPPVTQTDPALVERAMELQRQVYVLEREKLELSEDAAQAEPLREQLAEKMSQVEKLKLERDEARENFSSMQRDYDELLAQLKPINDLISSYEEKLRENLKKVPLGNVELRDGRRLENVTVFEVHSDSATLAHDGGTTKVEFTLLPDHLQRKFSFRPAMVTPDSLIAQKPVKPAPEKSAAASREDAAKAMREAMEAERLRTQQKLQDGYRTEIANLKKEVSLFNDRRKRIEAEKAAKRRDLNRYRKIKIAEADKQKAMRGFDFQLDQVKREIAQREARILALESMLDDKKG